MNTQFMLQLLHELPKNLLENSPPLPLSVCAFSLKSKVYSDELGGPTQLSFFKTCCEKDTYFLRPDKGVGSKWIE